MTYGADSFGKCRARIVQPDRPINLWLVAASGIKEDIIRGETHDETKL